MTRIVAYSLLAANAALELWQVTLGGEPSEKLPERAANVKLLMLLSEQQAGDPQGAQKPAASSNVTTEPGAICFTLGPFRSQDGAAQLDALLEG